MEKNIRKNFKTSYSISTPVYMELKEAAKLCDVSIPKLVKIVMARYVRKMHRQLIMEDNIISYNTHGEHGFKRVYVRWEALEYSIILQLKNNTRFGTSYMLVRAISECLGRIVMALLKRKNKSKKLKSELFKTQMKNLTRFFIFWPNIDVNIKALPFFEMHLDTSFY